MMRCTFILASLFSLWCSVAPAAEPFSFGVLGDVPYNRFERLHLPNVMAEMDAELIKVVIHDGDIKSGGERCDDAVYADRLALFNTSFHPFVAVPGDNDWTDCQRQSNGAYDPLERLEKLRSVFYKDYRRTLGQNPLKVESQADDPAHATFREHLRWRIGPVLFITLNVPGGGNNFGRKGSPSQEFVERNAAVHAWLQQGFALARKAGLEGVVVALQANLDIEDFSAGRGGSRGYRDLLSLLLAETQRFPGQVLLVHGDTHIHRIDKPLRDPLSRRAVDNFTRLETFGSPFMGWVKVDVTPGSRPLFRFAPRPYAPRGGD